MGLYPRKAMSNLANYDRRLGSNHWYVDINHGDNDSPGDRPEKPLLTIAEAVDRATDDTHDVIHLTVYVHAWEATPIVLNKRSLEVVGLMGPALGMQPQTWLVPVGNTPYFTIAAGDVSIKNFFITGGAAGPCINFGPADAGMVRNSIDNCYFASGTWGVETGGVNTPSHHLAITDCVFEGSLTEGGIYYAANGSWNLFKNNWFDRIPQGIIVISAGGTNSGRITNNLFSLQTGFGNGDAIAMMGSSAGYYITDNQAIDPGTDANSGGSPFGDNGTGNMWGYNTDGATVAEAPVAL